MLRVSLDFDRLTQAGRSPQEALAEMRQSASAYNPEVLSALERIDLAEADDKTGMLDDSLTDDPEVQLFHPIADEVLRAIRDLAPTE
jgi:hypothetical protein